MNNQKLILSKYNRYYQKEKDLIVLGGVSRAVIEFDNCSQDTVLDRIHTLSQEEVDYLLEYGIVVEEGTNEYLKYLSQFEEWRNNLNELTITIGMTFSCNFDCQYCIQKGNYDERNKITVKKADLIIKWIEEALHDNQQFCTLNINYFGGEPTLNLEVLFYISERLSEVCKVRGLDFYQQIVTNGYALDKDKIEKFHNHGINDFQITLDGLAAEHNNRRSRTFDSFSTIINNIIDLSNHHMRVFLLHVFDTSNIGAAFDLIDYFDKLAKNNSSLRDCITFNFVPTIPKRNNQVTCNKYVDGNEVLLCKNGVKAFSEAVKKGFKIANFLNIGHCFRQSENTVLISPNLDLYKCYGVFGNTNYAITNLSKVSFTDYLNLSKEVASANGFSEKCKTCDVVPFCRGGCQFSASENNGGKYGKSNCERNTIVESINGFLEHQLYNY